MPLADVIVIARGDLGQNLGLIRLPAAQLDLKPAAGKPENPTWWSPSSWLP